MINADEHKKLLARIAELEKNSVNYFDVEKEFFLIDSNNLSQVRPRLYGYSIQRNGIYEEDNLTPEAIAGLDGRGCYVYVDVQDGKITIKQDMNGSWGIYLFRHGDYFALSNSFFRLLDHVKHKYPLTVNRDYCHYLWVEALCSNAYSETAVNEVQLVDRGAILHIDVAQKNLEIELINYKEHSISPDSAEGIAALDRWIEFWSDVFRGLARHTNFISADLSGGFDSRISLLVLLHSGVDLNKLRIISIKGELGTHKEDYEIASKIAQHYGFKLNQPFSAQQFLNYSLTDIFNIETYGWQTFSNIPKYYPPKRIDKEYNIDGSGGETLRLNWAKFKSLEKFIETRTQRTNVHYRDLSLELSNSTRMILNSAFNNMGIRYNIKNKEEILLQYLVQETQCRNHFGKDALGNYFYNALTFSPAIDPDVRTVQLNTSECPDYNLLVALIFNRYAPNLLTFPFNSVNNEKRSIAPETIEYAKKINERFPLVKKDKLSISDRGIFHLQPRDTQAEKILSSGRNNPAIPGGLLGNCLKAIFNSGRTFGLFTTHFDKELYRYAVDSYENNDFARERPSYAIVGISKVLEDVEISQRNHPQYQDMKRFLEQDFATIHDEANKVIHKFNNYFTARMDIKFMSTEGDFQILSVSDGKATVWKPDWMNKDGIGYQIQSYAGNLEIVAKATVDGKIQLLLMGIDVRDPEDNSKFIPYWVDYTKLMVNGKTIFDEITPAWHNKKYPYIVDAKAGEEIKIQIEWLPHRSDT